MTHLLDAITRCTRCALYKQCSSPVLPVFRYSSVMVIGRNPGEQEDLRGEPFVGRAGRLLDEFLAWAELSRDHCYITNVVKCFTRLPVINRAPEPEEIKACSYWLEQELELLAPKLIIAIGSETMNLIRPGARPGRYHGKVLEPTREPWKTLMTGATVFAIYHPSYILRSRTKLESEYKDDAKVLADIVKEIL